MRLGSTSRSEVVGREAEDVDGDWDESGDGVVSEGVETSVSCVWSCVMRLSVSVPSVVW